MLDKDYDVGHGLTKGDHTLGYGERIQEVVFGVGSIPVAILLSCQNMQVLHHNCIEINI